MMNQTIAYDRHTVQEGFSEAAIFSPAERGLTSKMCLWCVKYWTNAGTSVVSRSVIVVTIFQERVKETNPSCFGGSLR